MPRPLKLTPVLKNRLLKAIRTGATHKLACQYAGIGEETLYRWLRLGGQGRHPYREFWEALKKAEGTAAVGWLEHIEQAAGEGSWQAAAWKLERRYPDEYGRQIIQHELSSDERQQRIAALLARRNGHVPEPA
jgi:transposase-like protein